MASPFDHRIPARPPHPGTAERILDEAEANASRIRQMLAFGRTDVSEADLAEAESTVELARRSLSAQAGAAIPTPTSGMASLASMLPVAARTAASGDGSVFNPKIWDEDLKHWRGRKFSISHWLGVCRAVVRKWRDKGDVERVRLMAVCQVLERDSRKAEDGKASLTLERIAELTDGCIDTARKCIRWLEKAGLVDTFNVLTRGPSGKLVRAANLYLLTTPDDAPAPEMGAEDGQSAPPAATQAPASVMARFARAEKVLRKWVGFFPGLVIRQFGYNTTPERPRKAPREPLPEPG